jgi:hypothetical protein
LLSEINLLSDFWWRLNSELGVVEPEELLHWNAFCLDGRRSYFGIL